MPASGRADGRLCLSSALVIVEPEQCRLLSRTSLSSLGGTLARERTRRQTFQPGRTAPRLACRPGIPSLSLVHGGAAPDAPFLGGDKRCHRQGKAILASLRQQLNLSEYRKKHWEGTFEEYLDIVVEHPEVTRTAYQRLYDMILSHGTEEVYENKEKIIRYKFFTEFAARHGDAIYGLDRPLMQLVNTFKSAAKGYGTERRVLLLHGPVG